MVEYTPSLNLVPHNLSIIITIVLIKLPSIHIYGMNDTEMIWTSRLFFNDRDLSGEDQEMRKRTGMFGMKRSYTDGSCKQVC